MSIFGRSHTAAATAPAVTAPVYEGYGVEVNGDILAIQESWEDQLAVIEALHSVDMEELALRSDIKTLQESTASEEQIEARYAEYETVTEAAVGDVWEKIKKFFSNLWGKIQAFFKTVVRVFDGIFKSAQDFVKKYGAQLEKLDLKGFKYKMYKYTNIDDIKLMELDLKDDTDELYVAATKSAVQGENDHILDNLTAKIREKKDEELDAYRGKIIGSGSLNAEQFSKALYSEFRGGAKTKEDKVEVEIDIKSIIAAINNAGEGKKKAEAFAKTVDEQFARIIKDINTLASSIKSSKPEEGETMKSVDLGDGKGGVRRFKADGSSKVANALRLYGTIFSTKKGLQLQVFRAWQDAWKERNSVYKQVCVAALSHKAGK